MDIHNYKRMFERTIERIKSSKDFSEGNKKTTLEFINHLSSENIGPAKIVRYVAEIIRFNKMLNKNFIDANKGDMRKVIAELNQTDLCESTKKETKIMLRKLYRFIRGIDTPDVYPDEVKWISLKISERNKKLPEELLTEEEMLLLIRNCQNVRNKALIASLCESGCRVGEIGSMQIKHVSFEEHGARLTVDGKTGMRKILVVNSAPYLQEWINQHPNNDNPDAPLWHNTQKSNFLCYRRIAFILKSAAKRAKIKKRVHLHLLRHSRATQLAKIMSESQMKYYLGWSQSSRMALIYVHLSGKDVDDTILKENGIELKNTDKKESKLKAQKCMKCKTVNQTTNKFCKSCGFILDKREAEEHIIKEAEKQNMNNVLNTLLGDKEILQMLMVKLKENNTLQ